MNAADSQKNYIESSASRADLRWCQAHVSFARSQPADAWYEQLYKGKRSQGRVTSTRADITALLQAGTGSLGDLCAQARLELRAYYRLSRCLVRRVAPAATTLYVAVFTQDMNEPLLAIGCRLVLRGLCRLRTRRRSF